MRDQCTFFRSFWDAAKLIKKKGDRLAFLEAILAFALDEEERSVPDSIAANFLLVKPTLISSAKKAKSGSAGGKQTRSKPEANRKQTGREKEGEDEKEGENEKENECYSARARFAPPSLAEVSAYCAARGNAVDPEAFIAFYASKGWKVGNQPMKDWKQAVITWEKRQRAEPSKTSTNQFAELVREGYFDDQV